MISGLCYTDFGLYNDNKTEVCFDVYFNWRAFDRFC